MQPSNVRELRRSTTLDPQITQILAGLGVHPMHRSARLSDFAELPDRFPSFVWGHTGVGKTHLAVAYLARSIENSGEAGKGFIRSLDLAKKLRAAWYRQSEETTEEIIARFSAYRFLVIDDMGCEIAASPMQEALYILLDNRWGHRLSTIITSQYDIDELSDMFSNYGDRLASRIDAMGKIIEVIGPDHREFCKRSFKT